MKIFLAVLFSFSLVLMLFWFVLTQPTTVENTDSWKRIVDPETLRHHVKMLSQNLPGRSDDVDQLNLSADYIYSQFNKYSTEVERQPFPVWGIDYQNIVAKFGPKDSGEIYVVGAHYDTFEGLPGANDNASGIAGLLELARLLSEQKPSARVHLVAFALEEPPYFNTKDMGSFFNAAQLKQQGKKVALMVCLEMIGYFSDKSQSQEYPLPFMKYFYSDSANYIAVVGQLKDFGLTRHFKKKMRQATPLPVYSINGPAWIPGIDFSDHQNFWYQNYPAIMITDTAFYRNRNYHKKTDTWDTLNYERMSMVVQGVYSALRSYMQRHE